MLTCKYEDVIKFIKNHPQGIYVWVAAGNETYRSIRIEEAESIRWCNGIDKEMHSVPCFIATDEIFLGSIDKFLQRC